MLTVTVALESSGNKSTRRPLGIRYSVMPSTAVNFLRLAGDVSGFQPSAGTSFGGMGRGPGLSPIRGEPGASFGAGLAGALADAAASGTSFGNAAGSFFGGVAGGVCAGLA